MQIINMGIIVVLMEKQQEQKALKHQEIMEYFRRQQAQLDQQKQGHLFIQLRILLNGKPKDDVTIGIALSQSICIM
jgi:hypothetical protein